MDKSLVTGSAIALLFLGFTIIGSYAKLEVIQSWRYVEFQYNSPAEEAEAIMNGSYNFARTIPIDVLPAPGGKMFLTVRREDGVPATLTTVITGTKGKGGGPLLRPYPDWSWANPEDCKSLIGVYRMDIDECNRLWVVDSGKIEDRLVCPPKILAFNTTTDQVVTNVEIPNDVVYGANGKTFFENIVAETEGADCAKTTIYVADSEGNGLVIWNGDAFWRVSSPAFEPDPSATTFSVTGSKSIENTHGLMGMALTAEPSPLDRHMYFRPLSSYKIYDTKIADLHRYRTEQGQLPYTTEPVTLPGQSIVHSLANQRVLFFSSVKDSSILCWNREKEFTTENIATVEQNFETLEWASGLKVLPKNGEKNLKLWVLTNRWQNFQNATIPAYVPDVPNYYEFLKVNFRVLSADVNDLINGTICA